MEDQRTAPDLLAARLSDLTDGLERARIALDEEAAVRAKEITLTTSKLRAAQRAVRVALAAIAVAVTAAIIGLVVTLGQNLQDRTQAEQLERLVAQQALDRCETGNVSRQAIRDGFDAYTAALLGVPPTAVRTPEQQAAHDARIAAFQADIAARLAPLGPRDCSPQALGVPAATGD